MLGPESDLDPTIPGLDTYQKNPSGWTHCLGNDCHTPNPRSGFASQFESGPWAMPLLMVGCCASSVDLTGTPPGTDSDAMAEGILGPV